MVDVANHPFSDKLGGAPHSKRSLRLWLRLLSCSIVVEKRIRARLGEHFKSTLPRFDVLAAVERHTDGVTMTALSDSLMVSNGNVTGVVTRLIEDALLTRTVEIKDRRSATVRLTQKGRDHFLRMASIHEQWVDEMFADMTEREMSELMKLLTVLRRSIEAHPDAE
jgi:DNA-binding MarR family transcriptional regulator